MLVKEFVHVKPDKLVIGESSGRECLNWSGMTLFSGNRFHVQTCQGQDRLSLLTQHANLRVRVASPICTYLVECPVPVHLWCDPEICVDI